jgi:hypothetical protein
MLAPSLRLTVEAADAAVAAAHDAYRVAHDSGDDAAAGAAEGRLREAFASRAKVNDRVVAAAAAGADAGGHQLERIDNGWRVKSTDEYVVEVWKTLFNWRLVVMVPNQQSVVEHGFCYFGLGLESLTRAIAAGLEWEDPFITKPNGFDKQAF